MLINNKLFEKMKKITLLLATATILWSCGGGTSEKTTEQQEQQTEESSSEPGEKEFTIKVLGNTMADMAYDQSLLTVNAGDKVVITLVNENQAEGMYHNIVIVKLGSGQEVATAAIEAGKDKDFVPENPNVIAASEMAAPLETVTFEFTAPEKGSYNYICTYPGHFPKMIGKLIVK